MNDPDLQLSHRQRFEETIKGRRQTALREREEQQARLREQEAKRRRADDRGRWAGCLTIGLLLGLAAWGAWWVFSGLSDWLDGPDRDHAAAAPGPSHSPLPAPLWKLPQGEETKNATLSIDMHDTRTLRLLEHVSAEDTRTIRIDDLDDDKGLTSADVEITVTEQPRHGRLELQADNSLAVYTPQPGFDGADTFEYTVKLRTKPEVLKISYTVQVGLSMGARYDLEHKYENCDAAQAAGAAPLRRGEDGYGRHLDADMDGIACE
ncbi:excalibur calcium-binding domain-containing protein (plasmid) [Streptomyces sp. NBC_00513]|uniref:excalibur calcium-binding domain-containing protein n=1 Tax=unclassified Streptomyces TaxID=2593676 RepID=UPI002256FA3D|nr:excalibur calcium-binding domain-containing protein [Streptomyces sp. NBC_00424]MCX5079244.1 excalibur calcium-binding domain-containing protein [Streptomyces sp. NBC_00424]WUD46428.1 excalibur calcium-binding domain-containing protein [Streptomyces sp. NBC_00513]